MGPPSKHSKRTGSLGNVAWLVQKTLPDSERLVRPYAKGVIAQQTTSESLGPR